MQLSLFKEEETESEAKNKKSLLSQMTGHDWWKDKVKWIRPLHLGLKAPDSDYQTDNQHNQLLAQNFHPFYQTLMTREKQFHFKVE